MDKFNDIYHDPRTGGRSYNHIHFIGEESDESYSPEYFAAHSEHVTLEGGYMLITYPYADGASFYGWEGAAV